MFLLSSSAFGAVPPSRFTVSGDGTVVTDNVTGLVWERILDPAVSRLTLTGAGNHCASLNTSSFGGFSTGWRLPRPNELISVVVDPSGAWDTAVWGPAITKVNLWTSEYVIGGTTSAIAFASIASSPAMLSVTVGTMVTSVGTDMSCRCVHGP
jgi:hypothetical protein